jgi:ferrous iron transport protein B
MGLTPGVELQVIRVAPLGDPVEVRVRGSSVSLRKETRHRPAGGGTDMSKPLTIGVVGNPNCGKTTLFNALTGSRQRVGNWPGVTVERKVGRYRFEGAIVHLVDLPGTYSLDVSDHDLSLDERIARDFIHDREADLVLNILDATNLERNLYLTTQLIEMGRPLVLALNMMDVARERGLKIDVGALADRLGCPVSPSRRHGRGHRRPQARPPREPLGASRPEGPDPLSAVPRKGDRRAPAASRPDRPRQRRLDPAGSPLRLLEGDDLARRLVGWPGGARRDP